MNKIIIETAVGTFMVAGLLCLLYLAINLGGISLTDGDRLHLTARFVSSSGLKKGAFVEVGGVRVGTVEDIHVDHESYESVVRLAVDPRLQLQDDTIASIRTSGIIGDKFVKITPGGSDTVLQAGGEILETESSISIEELISKYIFESGGKEK